MVHLREITKSDRDQILAWRNLPDVAKHMYSGHLITAKEHAAWFACTLDDDSRKYWIIYHDGRGIGLANLYDITSVHRRCSWAFYVAEPDIRGQGIGSYVEFFILSYVFDLLNFNKLCCEVFATNEPVWKMHLKFGFVQEALYHNHIFKDDTFHDVVALAMFRECWHQRREAHKALLIERDQVPPVHVARKIDDG